MTLVMAMREKRSAAEASPTAGVDRQPIGEDLRKAAGRAAIDAGKKIKGRKRHIVTDTQGHLVGVQSCMPPIFRTATEARSVSSPRSAASTPGCAIVFADGGYAGDKLRGALAAASARGRIEIIKRSDRRQGLRSCCRGDGSSSEPSPGSADAADLAKDFETTIASPTAWVLVAHIRTITRRLARA
ncbi:MAG: transposase [Rhodoblastus sp.]